MRLAILILLFPVILSAQIWKGNGLIYGSGSPTHNPGYNGAWVYIDTLTGQWSERDQTAGVWREMGARLQATNTTGAPSYTPTKQRGRLAINSGDSLYYYQAGTWTHINAGGSVDLTPYVQYADSNLVFITPTTLDDSTAAIRADFPVIPTDTVSLMINDTIIGYFVNGGEVGRDTIRASGSGGGVSGSGTTNYVSKWTGTTALGNSVIYDNGSGIGLSTTSISDKLEINSNETNGAGITFALPGNTKYRIGSLGTNVQDWAGQFINMKYNQSAGNWTADDATKSAGFFKMDVRSGFREIAFYSLPIAANPRPDASIFPIAQFKLETGDVYLAPGGFGSVGIGTNSPFGKFQVTGIGSTTATGTIFARNSSGTNLFFVNDGGQVVVYNELRMGSTTGPMVKSGSGSPEGAVTAPVGSMFLRTNGGAGTTLYIKESGTGNTGWIGK